MRSSFCEPAEEQAAANCPVSFDEEGRVWLALSQTEELLSQSVCCGEFSTHDVEGPETEEYGKKLMSITNLLAEISRSRQGIGQGIAGQGIGSGLSLCLSVLLPQSSPFLAVCYYKI
ncbi:MAG: hypothetical protein HY268_02510 [Deltaproteobacteria bacterium]|nr:hypothetical protein [Deltaproteobacteria bacterium]